MTVDPKEKNEMARLIALMNEGVVFEEPSAISPSSKTSIVEGSFGQDNSGLDPAVAAMKNILQAFNGTGSINGTGDRVVERATQSRELREALMTEVTDRGTRVGSWEIAINEDYQGLKNFDVNNVHTGEPIASNLTVYDAALGIARHLNEGLTINSKEIREILNTEASYDSARQDAALFKSRMDACAHTGNFNRGAIMEARYIESLEKAKSARIKLSRVAR